MGFLELFLIAVGLSMDAFAVSICKGLALQKLRFKHMLQVGLYFGIFQAGMPLLGYLIGVQFAAFVETVDHWIAFVLLLFIGANMVRGSLQKEDDPGEDIASEEDCEALIGPRKMFPLALATSIDAFAIGVSFAFLQVQIIPAVSFIGTTTLLLSMLGVRIGHVFGTKYKSRAELVGGVILILIGANILLQHLGVY